MRPFIIRRQGRSQRVCQVLGVRFFDQKWTGHGCEASSIDVEPACFDAEAVKLNGVSAGDDVEPAGSEVSPVSLELETVVCD